MTGGKGYREAERGRETHKYCVCVCVCVSLCAAQCNFLGTLPARSSWRLHSTLTLTLTRTAARLGCTQQGTAQRCTLPCRCLSHTQLLVALDSSCELKHFKHHHLAFHHHQFLTLILTSKQGSTLLFAYRPADRIQQTTSATTNPSLTSDQACTNHHPQIIDQ